MHGNIPYSILPPTVATLGNSEHMGGIEINIAECFMHINAQSGEDKSCYNHTVGRPI